MSAVERVVPGNGTALATTNPTEVSGLIALALEQKVPVEVLERLVALQERVTIRNARAAFFEAVSAFQEDCPDIRKSKTAKIVTKGGSSYDYTYAPLEKITATIRPLLRLHGLSYSWNAEQAGSSLLITCILRHIEGHEERSTFPVPVDSAAAMSAAQKNGAALTYGRRQSLVAVLGLTTADEDSDATARETRSADKITDAQAADLSDLIDAAGVDAVKFLRWLEVESARDVLAADLERATRVLRDRIAKGGAE